jgi:cell division septation protein DedD
VSHSQEPSYYEIALTNRQVLVIFVVLLVCVVAAFFSGVWIGRGGGGEAGSTPMAEVDTAAETPETAVNELHFFSDESAASEANSDSPAESLPQVAAAASPDTTLLEDVGGPAAGSDPGGEAQAEAGQRAPVAAPGAAAPHVVQVFSSADESQAQQLVRRLSSGGYPAFLSPVEVRGRTMYRVRIGPYTELPKAEDVAERVRQSYKLDTWVTQ